MLWKAPPLCCAGPCECYNKAILPPQAFRFGPLGLAWLRMYNLYATAVWDRPALRGSAVRKRGRGDNGGAQRRPPPPQATSAGLFAYRCRHIKDDWTIQVQAARGCPAGQLHSAVARRRCCSAGGGIRSDSSPTSWKERPCRVRKAPLRSPRRARKRAPSRPVRERATWSRARPTAARAPCAGLRFGVRRHASISRAVSVALIVSTQSPSARPLAAAAAADGSRVLLLLLLRRVLPAAAAAP